MTTVYQVVVGGIAVLLGIAWVVAPMRMSRYQNRLRFFKPDEEQFEETDRRKRIGRIGGLVLVALGAAFAVGLIP